MPPLSPVVVSTDEAHAPLAQEVAAEPDPDASDQTVDSDEEAVVAGTLRSPWKWEELIVESAVVGGRSRADGKARIRATMPEITAITAVAIANIACVLLNHGRCSIALPIIRSPCFCESFSVFAIQIQVGVTSFFRLQVTNRDHELRGRLCLNANDRKGD